MNTEQLATTWVAVSGEMNSEGRLYLELTEVEQELPMNSVVILRVIPSTTTIETCIQYWKCEVFAKLIRCNLDQDPIHATHRCRQYMYTQN